MKQWVAIHTGHGSKNHAKFPVYFHHAENGWGEYIPNAFPYKSAEGLPKDALRFPTKDIAEMELSKHWIRAVFKIVREP